MKINRFLHDHVFKCNYKSCATIESFYIGVLLGAVITLAILLLI